jgi:hypothetical protein
MSIKCKLKFSGLSATPLTLLHIKTRSCSPATHRILELPLFGPSLSYHAMQLPVITRVSAAKQLLVALKGFHDVGLVLRGTPLPAILVLDIYIFQSRC